MATHPPSGADPRIFAPPAADVSVLPMVARPRQGVPGWAVGAGAVVAGLLLFAVLDSRRRAAEAPSFAARPADQVAVSAAPPPLVLPPDYSTEPVAVAPVTIVPQPVAPRLVPAPAPLPAPAPRPQIVYVPQPTPMALPPIEAPQPQRQAAGAALIVDTGSAAAPSAAGDAAQTVTPAAAAGASAVEAGIAPGLARVRAGTFANRSTTIAQGTLIAAVLETSLDSTRPGFARAIVSRDVRGFDGSQILIPRGSRLIGEYRSDVARGQRRAMVNWTRLIRPDGVTIALGSPATDTLGGGGIRAHVNSHFFERFAGSLLQSTLGLGASIAGGLLGNGSTVVLLPGTLENVTQTVQPSQVTPTLTVRRGTSISIFVARDLDFTGAGAR
jgi:type IV secretion system protein VirB10